MLRRTDQLAEPDLSYIEGLKQVPQTAGFVLGLSNAQGRDSFPVSSFSLVVSGDL